MLSGRCSSTLALMTQGLPGQTLQIWVSSVSQRCHLRKDLSWRQPMRKHLNGKCNVVLLEGLPLELKLYLESTLRVQKVFKKAVHVLSLPTLWKYWKRKFSVEMYYHCNRNKWYETQMFQGGSKFHSVQWSLNSWPFAGVVLVSVPTAEVGPKVY